MTRRPTNCTPVYPQSVTPPPPAQKPLKSERNNSTNSLISLTPAPEKPLNWSGFGEQKENPLLAAKLASFRQIAPGMTKAVSAEPPAQPHRPITTYKKLASFLHFAFLHAN